MNIAIMGFGTVGRGAYLVARETQGIDVVKVLVRTLRKDMQEMVLDSEKNKIFTQDISDIINDESIDLVIESIGGTEIAKEYVMQCLNAGKHVVTPNKNLVSMYYKELHETAQKNSVEFRYTATAGGGIPWLFNLRRTKRCDEILEVRGIVNGTCNYILDAMHKEHVDYSDILKKAQELGYAEADPTADVDGIDTLRKTVISTNIAFDTTIQENEVPCFGISSIKTSDITWFEERNYTCKLMMNAKLCGDKLSVYVEPVLFQSDSLEASVGSNNNLITFVGKNIGTQSFYGQGAGMYPTGESVMQDVIDINDEVKLNSRDKHRNLTVDNSKEIHNYYARKGSEIIEMNGISVEEIHKWASDCKEQGIEVFFAKL